MGRAIDFGDIERARPSVAKVAMRTPVFRSRLLTELAAERRGSAGAEVVLKAENLQRTGSFKIRGVLSKLAALGESAKAGIVVASAGNHAQAAAFGASQAGVPCHVFMPAGASIAKADATESYGATVELGGASIDECLDLARRRADETGEILVHPFDDPAIIAGQGTLGLELAEDIEDLSLVVVPIGGGGLVAGIAVALKELKPDVRLVGVQAAGCAPFVGSEEKSAAPLGDGTTLADGIAIKRPGTLTGPIVRELVDDVVAVGEDDIADAMVLLLERAKLVVEGAGAVGVAAWLADLIETPPSGTAAVVLSGGNVDTGLLTPAIRRRETHAGRRLVVFARIPDRPGALAGLLSVVGAAGGNLVTVEHLREGYDLHVRETALHIVIETRNPEHARAVLERVRATGYEAHPVASSAVERPAAGRRGS